MMNLDYTSKAADSLIKYESEIQMAQTLQQYQKTKKNNINTQQSKPSPQDILNAIIPPREWVSQQKLYVQYVSHSSVSRDDATRLKNMLLQKLKQRQARESGICPIRQQLYSQCFDQLIRQVTIDCPQRGLLLMRVRDQLKMTIAAYQTLYQSSVSFGMRKQLKAEQGMEDFQNQIINLQKLKGELQEKRIQLNCKRDSIQKKIKQRQNIQQSRMRQELEFLKYQAGNLKTFLSSIKNQSK